MVSAVGVGERRVLLAEVAVDRRALLARTVQPRVESRDHGCPMSSVFADVRGDEVGRQLEGRLDSGMVGSNTIHMWMTPGCSTSVASTPARKRSLHQAAGVVEQRLTRANLNQQRRQPGQVGEQR